MVEQIANFHKLKFEETETNAIYCKDEKYLKTSTKYTTLLLSIKADFSELKPEEFKKVTYRLKQYSESKWQLFYDVDIDNQIVKIKVSTNPEMNAKIKKSIQVYNHMNDEQINKLKEVTKIFKNISNEDKEKAAEFIEKFRDDLKPLIAKLDEIPKNEENITVCHGDLHFENFLVDKEDKVILIDFDLIGRNFFYNDIALLLNHVSGRPEFTTKKLDGFEECLDVALKKYIEVRPLSISYQLLKQRVRLFRPVLLLFWMHIFAYLFFAADKETAGFWFKVLLPHYRRVCDKVLKS